MQDLFCARKSTITPSVLLFRRIFNFEPVNVAQMTENRLNARHAPGATFPLQASLSLADHDWRPVRVRNMSGHGIALLAAREVEATEGQDVKVKLELGEHRLELEGRLAHMETSEQGLLCGIGFKFTNFLAQKAYLQLLQPIAIGQSLAAVPAERVVQNEPQFIKQVFRGEEGAVLTVWLAQAPGLPLHSFEFQMHDYFCHGDAQSGVLEAYLREASDSHKGKLTNPVFDQSGALHDEIRQLVRWLLPNLSAAVPVDMRVFLQRFAG